jgi:hypothetical protein
MSPIEAQILEASRLLAASAQEDIRSPMGQGLLQRSLGHSLLAIAIALGQGVNLDVADHLLADLDRGAGRPRP